MYDRRKWCARLLAKIQAEDVYKVLKDKYALLLQVELGLHLIEWLGLSDEPITVLWALLSDDPLSHPRLLALDAQQRHARANARILLPFASRFNWENTLQTYAMIDEQWCRYRVFPDKLEEQKVFNLGTHDERLPVYDQALEGILSFAKRTIEPAGEGLYFFDAIPITEQGKQVITVDIDAESAGVVTIDLPWFTEPRARQPLEYSYDDFCNLARDLDDLVQRANPTSTSGSQRSWFTWVDEMLGYRAILSNKSLAARNETPLRIDGHAYVVGAVASGKSTIAKLIMADAALHPEKELRITLVVSDTMSALNLADEFNELFCKPGDAPVAVPLIGRSTRDLHLQRLYRSSKFRSRSDHWGLRSLNPACPMQALATNTEFLSTRPGAEPCESLYTLSGEPEARKTYHFCPLFAVCPSKQHYRDMPTACIWITTPGALGRSSVPSQLEERKVSLTEIVYEQSDLVIFDEADTVQEWFDNLFAEEVSLTNGNNGILDVEDVETAQALVPRRTQPPSTRRWVEAERHSLASISNILSGLTDREQGPMLQRWIERNYFTALTLAYKLLWRLLGFPKWEDYQGKERIEADKKVKPLIAYFDKLNQKDPLKIKRPPDNAENDPVYRLALIMRILLAAGDSTHNKIADQECRDWILDFIPNIEQTRQKLEQELEEWKKQPPKKSKKADAEPPDTPDTLETLAQRLEFVLNVMILNRNIRVVFYEWYNKPFTMSTDLNDTSLQGAPDNLKDVLPIPPTGRVFGTYYSNGLEIGQDDPQKRELPSSLSVFSYSNIGRWYTMNFHKLFTALDYKRGPNVLSLSGTSWLPHSSRWHIDIPPQGILEPPKEAQEAIEQSVFSYIPQYRLVDKNTLKEKLRKKKGQVDQTDDEKETLEPIFISGITKKMRPIKELVRALASDQNGRRSPLREELEGLQNLSRTNREYWADRERLLLIVNSYDQARWAYDELRFSETYRGEICYLERNNQGRDEVVVDTDAIVYRSDIEDFALPDKTRPDEKRKGRILIAPMQAIGRGYNILNESGKAAFGAIYFLTRPMPYPADTQALARELNRRTLDWCQKQDLPIWQEELIYKQALALREKADAYWRKAELRTYYTRLEHKDIYNDKQYSESERFDLAATTVGHIIQACGRLLRGGVPFHAFFVDAAWAPEIARKKATEELSRTSLLTAMFEVLQIYVQDQIGSALYAPIVGALKSIDGFEPKY